MTKLSTHIPIEYIKKCEKLQEMDFEYKYFEYVNGHISIQNGGFSDSAIIYSAPTISDIIDNAEELFGDDSFVEMNWGTEKTKFKGNKFISFTLIELCRQNKPIEEISKYIIDNIK